MPGQLRMQRTHYDALPALSLPPGYGLRTYVPGDEAHWARIINSVGNLGEWDVARTRRDLTGRPQFDPKGLFFATRDGRPVGTACAWRDRPDASEMGQLHMVAVDPAHRGCRLGTAVSLAVIRYFEAHGFHTVYLMTDDFRLAAVKTYLSLGFEPVLVEEDHAGRWERLYELLEAGSSGSDGGRRAASGERARVQER